MVGNPGILENTNMTSAKVIEASGKLDICDTLEKSAGSDNPPRAKIKAAEIEIMTIGICETKPSPTVNVVKVKKVVRTSMS